MVAWPLLATGLLGSLAAGNIHNNAIPSPAVAHFRRSSTFLWLVKPKLPFIPGHEGVGCVAAVGPDVLHVKEGDRVGVPWLHEACGICEHCLTGWETLCQQQQNTGYSVDGGLAEYVLAPVAYVGHLSDGLDFTDAAPILCAGVTTYKGLSVGEAINVAQSRSSLREETFVRRANNDSCCCAVP